MFEGSISTCKAVCFKSFAFACLQFSVRARIHVTVAAFGVSANLMSRGTTDEGAYRSMTVTTLEAPATFEDSEMAV
jgi:hypothetical protein